MPHITIDYSPLLLDAFDRQAFVAELHPLVLDVAGSAGVCKTLCRRATEAYVGGGRAEPAAFVHVTVGLLAGRTDGRKARLSEDVLALLDKHLSPGAGSEAVASVEVRDLADTYRLRHSCPRDPAARREPAGSRE